MTQTDFDTSNMRILKAGDTVNMVLLNDGRIAVQFRGGRYFDPWNYKCISGNDTRLLNQRQRDEAEDLLSAAIAERDRLTWEEEKPEPAPEPEPAPATGGVLENLLSEMMERAGAGGASDADVDAAVKRYMNDHKPSFNVVTADNVKQVEGVAHEKLQTVLTLVANDEPVFLSGPAGSGKNVICKQVAEALGLDFYFTNAVTQEYKLTGFIDANGTYHETEFYKAFTRGGLFFLDEMDASVPETLVILNAAIANGYFDFANGHADAAPDFRVIAAGNTYGTGADLQYSGRYQLDAASLDRFAVVSIGYDEKIEMTMTGDNKELVDFAHAYRQAANEAGMMVICSYRALRRIAKLEAAGMNLVDVMRIGLLKGMGSDDGEQLQAAWCQSKKNRYYEAMEQATELASVGVF